MDGRYKLVLSNRNLYKEIELEQEAGELRIGTSEECNVKLRKNLFFAPIELLLRRMETGWSIFCSDNLYFTVGDVRKLLTKKLTHGDELAVKYQDSDNDVLFLSFMIDFDYEKKDYDLELDLTGKSRVSIGGAEGCDIRLSDEYLQEDTLTLEQSADGRVTVTDNASKYGVFVNGARITGSKEIHDIDFFSIVRFSFYYRAGKLYTSAKDCKAVRGLESRRLDKGETHLVYPKFNRNSRIQYVIPQEELEIQQAAAKPQKSKKNLAMSLIPALIMLAMTIILRGVVGGGGTFVIYSVVSMGLGAVMSVVTYISEGKAYKEEWQKRIDTYHQYIQDKESVIVSAREDELRVRNLIYESLENSIRQVEGFGRRLFERSAKDADFLQIYLGKGRVESANAIKYNKQEFIDMEDPLATIPEKLAEKYRYIEQAPVISDFNASCGVGIVGSPKNLLQALKNITLDLCIRHFYGDVRTVYVLSEPYLGQMKWLRWLHNVENQNLGVRSIVCDEESRNVILEDLYSTLSARENAADENKDKIFERQYVVFVTDASSISTHPISKYVKDCVRLGFTFVFLEQYEEMLPQGCTELIRLDDADGGEALKTQNGDQISFFRYPFISDRTAEEVALRLGAVTVDEVSLEGELTKNITMFEMLGILAVEDLNLQKRWASSQVHRSMAAPLGVKSKNQIVYLDISDKAGAHGPHGLVAGTTGSGKSEVLQTYMLSMATLFHPYEAAFVVIDFKGGGMANQFKNLPHLMGTITNIDGHEINRSLLSIKAELVKRQEIFSQSGVNHINDYISLFKEKKVQAPLPHLIMIVDEFAELKAEYPDFMKELISAARIGRTLGVHLILATQKPAGVVDSQIWSNSKFKLCLKVQTKEDSNEVLKTPLAAEIVEPGRAYFQVGNNEIFELFQSAYSGASIPSGNDVNEKVYAVYEKNLWGKKQLKYTNKKAKTDKGAVSQLQAIVDYVYEQCLEQGIERLPGICLPPLKNRISTQELSYEENDAAQITCPIGFFDDPEQQRQGEVVLEVFRDNHYIVGSAQSGKTVMLQTMIYGLLRKYTPKQVSLYLVDCGSMVLKLFEDSVHVGGVVLSNEEEKCKNLFKLLETLVIQRKKILSEKGIGNFASYLEAGYTDMPLAVVVIDNMAAFKEYFPNQAEGIDSLAREAQGVGISFVVTAVSSNALNYRTQANFGRKFVLNCNDSNEYGNVLGHSKDTPREYAGRGLFQYEKRILEFQTAMFGKSEREAERSQELRQFIADRNEECSDRAPKIPMIPEKLSLEKELDQNPQIFRKKGILPVGMDFETVDFSYLNLAAAGSLTLVGEAESRERFLKSFLRMLAKTVIFHNVEAWVVDDKNRRLSDSASYGFVKRYTCDMADGLAMTEDFCEEVKKRSDRGQPEDTIMVLALNSAEILKRICADKDQSRRFSDVLKTAKDAGAFLLLSGVENQPVGFNAADVLKTVKEKRQAIFFGQLSENKLFEVSGRVKAETSFDSTMGYRFNASACSKIKIFQ